MHNPIYGTEHKRKRAQWAKKVETGEVSCARRARPIVPGTRWHLGHVDLDPKACRGPEHAFCNLRAAGKLGGKMRTRKNPRRRFSRVW